MKNTLKAILFIMNKDIQKVKCKYQKNGRLHVTCDLLPVGSISQVTHTTNSTKSTTFVPYIYRMRESTQSCRKQKKHTRNTSLRLFSSLIIYYI